MTQTHPEATARTCDRSAVRRSYVSGASGSPLLEMTIGDALDRTVARFPNRDALISRQQGLRYTWTALRDEVDRFARGLMALNIHKGDRVGIWSPTHAEWTITRYACAKIGAVLVNVNPGYRLHELEYALNQSGCGALVLAPTFRQTSYIELMQALAPQVVRSAPGQLASHRLPHLRHVIRLGDEATAGMWLWGDVMARAAEVGVPA
jgi:fatty-acyl-CoA synthase